MLGNRDVNEFLTTGCNSTTTRISDCTVLQIWTWKYNTDPAFLRCSRLSLYEAFNLYCLMLICKHIVLQYRPA
jgi:hypothetical protein